MKSEDITDWIIDREECSGYSFEKEKKADEMLEELEYKKILKENQTLKNFVSGIFNENIEKDFIPVQKVKDKIKELEKKHVYQGNGYYCTGAILVLQELIEESKED